MSILLNISGLTIDFDTRYPEYVVDRCKGYVVEDGVADVKIRASEENIILANRDNVGLMEAELYAMTIPLSERMPDLGRLMTHGVAIECDGKAFIFTAESGVGKSTHAFLWQKYLGEERVHVINGDKPILWFKDGEILACGSPWSGKEHLDENRCVPLRGVCLLKRGKPRIVRATKEETLDFLMHQVFLPRNPMTQVKTFRMMEEMYEKVPVYHLWVDMSEEAVRVSAGRLMEDDNLNDNLNKNDNNDKDEDKERIYVVPGYGEDYGDFDWGAGERVSWDDKDERAFDGHLELD